MLRKCFNKDWTVGKQQHAFAALRGMAEAPASVTLPHDAMILTARGADNTTASGSGYYTPENIEYKKTFTVPAEDKGKAYFLEFEGVYMNASVWVNGAFAAKRPYGYTNFYVKLNGLLKYGGENEIKVVVKNNSQPNARWYSGTGIYRNVKLMTGEALHIKPDGVRISTPEIEPELAVVEVATDVEYDGITQTGGYVLTVLKAPDGTVVKENKAKFNLAPGGCITVRQRLHLEAPALWNVDAPLLYTCESSIIADDKTVDSDVNTFGIRKLQLDTIHGLRINGKTVNLKGGCIHHDNGLVGSATFEDAEERRARKMKEAGYNALRSAHHPMSKAMLDACDKVGMLVMDEFSDVWTQTKCDFDYGMHFTEWWEQDVEAMVRKDFNHPCVVLYSIGNEIPEVGSEVSASWDRKLAEKIRSIDETRYVTNGINTMFAVMDQMAEIRETMMGEQSVGGEINQVMSEAGEMIAKLSTHPIIDKYIEESCALLDVVGYNYATPRYEKDHEAYPDRVLVGSETAPAVLDANWELVEKNGYLIGDFSWTSWDYLGEAGIGHIAYDDDKNENFYGKYPWFAAYCADFDLLGCRRPISYWREIIWGGRGHVPYIAVQRPERYGQKVYPGMWSWTDSVSSWTWSGFEGKGAIAEVYSNAEEVELFVNGKSQGKKPVGDEFKKFYCKWDTVYEAGKVEAVAYIGGGEVGRYSLQTADAPVLIKVTKESESVRAGSNDLCYVNIELVDGNGILNTDAKKSITVKIEGPATIQGSGSANPRCEENYFDSTHETFYGRVMAVVRAGNEKGVARLTVSADGMKDVIAEIPVI
jgi:beta-galactosidase